MAKSDDDGDDYGEFGSSSALRDRAEWETDLRRAWPGAYRALRRIVDAGCDQDVLTDLLIVFQEASLRGWLSKPELDRAAATLQAAKSVLARLQHSSASVYLFHELKSPLWEVAWVADRLAKLQLGGRAERGRNYDQDLVIAAVFGYIKSQTHRYYDSEVNEIFDAISAMNSDADHRKASKSGSSTRRSRVDPEINDPDRWKMWRVRHRGMLKGYRTILGVLVVLPP